MRPGQLSVYGVMKEMPGNRIREIMNYLVLNGYFILSKNLCFRGIDARGREAPADQLARIGDTG